MRVRAARLAPAVGAITWLTLAVTVAAASPAPSAAAVGDPRSVGQGPGLVGDPASAVLAVLAIGLGAILLTLAYIRLTAPRRG